MVDEDEDKPLLDELFTEGGLVDGIMVDATAPPAEAREDAGKAALPRLLKRLQDRLRE